MYTVESLTRQFEAVFTAKQAEVLADAITVAYQELVKTGDFNELKEIVRDLATAQRHTELNVAELAQTQQRTELRLEELAQAQQRTELRLEGLAQAQQRTEFRLEELAQAQQRTELRLEELAQAQQRTESRLEELAERTEQGMAELRQAQQRTEVALAEMARAIGGMGRELGGLSRGMSYALENEAYRSLPAYLEREYGIKLTNRIVRADVAGQEINFLAQGEQNGEPVYLVGEAKLQIDERRENRRGAYEVFDQLERQTRAVAEQNPGYRIVPLLVTHYARPALLREAESRGVLVVQSFEW